MIKQKQDEFYELVGRTLQVARQRRNMSVAELCTASGEQHKTIRGIEEGRPTSLHHAVWMMNILGIDLNAVIRDHMEGNNGKGNEEINGAIFRLEDFI